MAKIPQLVADRDGWTAWQQDGAEFTHVCCGCGLAHKWKLRKRRGRFQYKLSLDRLVTTLVRRHMPKFLKLRD